MCVTPNSFKSAQTASVCVCVCVCVCVLGLGLGDTMLQRKAWWRAPMPSLPLAPPRSHRLAEARVSVLGLGWGGGGHKGGVIVPVGICGHTRWFEVLEVNCVRRVCQALGRRLFQWLREGRLSLPHRDEEQVQPTKSTTASCAGSGACRTESSG